MVKSKSLSYGLDYTKCTADELRGFIKSRTGHGSTSKSVSYLAARLKLLDKFSTFRFSDLPPELRVAIYAELLHRPDPYDKKRLHPQILATSKEIHREAEPELNHNANMLVKIAPYYYYSTKDVFFIGQKRMEFRNIVTEKVEFGSLWKLYDEMVTMVRDVRHITIDFRCSQRITGPRYIDLEGQFLFALAAALRGGKLQQLTLKVHDAQFRAGFGSVYASLWPLARIESRVEFSMEGVPGMYKALILSRRSEEDGRPDSITVGKKMVTRIEEMVSLLAHLNDPAAMMKIDKLRSKTFKATRWFAAEKNDARALKWLAQVKAAVEKPSMRKLIQKATEIKAAKDEKIGTTTD